jgi:enoyl-CoA hydratase
MTQADQAVLVEKIGAVGVLRLNRPQALNALTLEMVRQISHALLLWAKDTSVRCVIVTSAGGRAFCAGGDIRVLHDMGRAGHFDEALQFWREEYALNRLIKLYPKPYLALIDGMVMGGGVGVSLHGSHRIAGPNYKFAMPEVGIGFFPDVGATYVLPRLPDSAGVWLALTGARIDRSAALALGLATHAATSHDLAALIDDLAAGGDLDDVLLQRAPAPEIAPVLPDQDIIADCFSASTLGQIISQLDARAGGHGFAARALDDLRAKSPTSLAIATEQMRRGRNLSFEEAMALEFRIVSRVVRGHDFYEGVRAMIIDKDNSPQWQPARIADVDNHDVEAYFAPLADLELWSMPSPAQD